MRTLVWVAVAVTGMSLVMAPSALACGGHESRAADCLERLFGDNHVSGMSDHSLTVSVDGQSKTVHGAEQTMVEQLAQFLEEHGVQQTASDPCDSGSDAHNMFEDVNLAG